MSTEPLVSVVLPTYNAEPYLSEALEALRRQTFESFEILVVDDGSTDSTVETATAFAERDERFRVIEREDPTGGLPGALNEGIRRARGTFVARQDADDISAETRLEKQVAYLQRHPDVAMVGTATEFLSESGEVTDVRIPPSEPTFEALYEKNRFIHGSVLFRKDTVIDVGGYDESFDYSEDYDLWLRLASKYPVRNLRETLYQLRMRSESIYGSQLRSVKLHSWYARKRIRGEVSVSLDDFDDIEAIAELLSDAERVAFHTELCQENLRYERHGAARRDALAALRVAPMNPTVWGLLALTFVPNLVVEKVISLYRRNLNRKST